MKNRFLPFLILCLAGVQAIAQTFTVLPTASKPFYKGPTGTSGATTTFTSSDTSFSALSGIWITDNYTLKGGLMIETKIRIPSAKYSKPGCIFQKPGSISIGLDSGRLKVDYIAGSGDQVNGMRTLPVGQWITVRVGLDTLGRLSASVNGTIDIDRPTRFSGIVPEKADPFIFLQGFGGRSKYLKVWTDTKPDILTPGFDCYRLSDPDTVKFRIKRVDKSLIGKEFTITAQSPNGKQTTLYVGALQNQTYSFPFSTYVNGNWTFIVSCGKIAHIEPVMKAAKPVLPEYFINGLYFPNIKDFRFVKEKLRVNTIYCDFNILNFPPNYQQMATYLDSAQKLGLKSVVRMGYHSSKGNLKYVDSLKRSNIAWYYQDEASGIFDGYALNHWTKNATNPTVPGILNLNNFSRIDEASEIADILMLNIYSSGRNVYDITRQASQLKPTWVTLPQYGNIQYSTDTMINLVGQAVCAGASGIFWFEFDHRSKDKPNDFYTATRPELVERLRQAYALTQNVSLSYKPIQTGNPNVAACYRGNKLWIVNLSETTQTATIAGKMVSLNSLECWAQMDESQL